jgi:hypothetical protein
MTELKMLKNGTIWNLEVPARSVLFQMRTYDVNWNQAWFILPSEKDNDAFFYVLVNEKNVYYSTDYVLGKHITVNVRCVKNY